MIKKSQFASAWPTAYNLIKEMGMMRDLPPMHKIKLEHSLPESAGAFGYVTTEDSDDNGILDTMHIVVPNIDKHLQGIQPHELMRLKIEDPSRLQQILSPIVELIAHEQGHQKDYRHGEENPFPGGESVAEQAAQQALNQISTQATNNINKNDIKRSSNMKKEIISRLVKLAGDLDSKQAHKLSDEVITLAEKFAQELGELPKVDLKEVGRAAHSMTHAQLYHPDGDLMGERTFTGQVDFNWGTYTGKYADQPYYTSRGRTDLGSVQFSGDPFTYDPAGEGKLIVVSGPEDLRYAIGRTIPDPRARTVPAQQPKTAPEGAWNIMEGGPDAATRRESMLGKLDSDIANEAEKLEKIKSNLAMILGRMGFEGKSILTAYNKAINPAQQIMALESGIDFLNQRGYDVAPLEQQLAKLKTVAQNYRELLSARRKARESQAHDAELQPQSVDLEAEANLKADELVKNASINAVFWKPNTKTPFGR